MLCAACHAHSARVARSVHKLLSAGAAAPVVSNACLTQHRHVASCSANDVALCFLCGTEAFNGLDSASHGHDQGGYRLATPKCNGARSLRACFTTSRKSVSSGRIDCSQRDALLLRALFCDTAAKHGLAASPRSVARESGNPRRNRACRARVAALLPHVPDRCYLAHSTISVLQQ